MTLLFEDAGTSRQRKWQCFVCGKNYENYETYTYHITAEHDEGREYLSCPDCKAPVRDLKTHYKTKHPSRVVPKNAQDRVTVWYDFKPGKDGKMKRAARKPKIRRGNFTSNKCGCDFEYMSGMECQFFECLEADIDVETWAAQPLKIPYFWNADWHNYIPDIRINFIDGSTEIWEVKPANQTHFKQNQAKWAAANNYCSNIGWDFIVMTEVGLGKIRTKIKLQDEMYRELESYRTEEPPA